MFCFLLESNLLFPFILANERGDIKTPFLLLRYKSVFMYHLKEKFLKKSLEQAISYANIIGFMIALMLPNS
jgi:hypothetical protein